MSRRKPTPLERQIPCECCGHPISHRHHVLQVAKQGEVIEGAVIQLCPNCHELAHWCYRERTDPKYRWGYLWTQFCVMTDDQPRIRFIEWLTQITIRLERAMDKLKATGDVTDYNAVIDELARLIADRVDELKNWNWYNDAGGRKK